jgi:hypothetical protein
MPRFAGMRNEKSANRLAAGGREKEEGKENGKERQPPQAWFHSVFALKQLHGKAGSPCNCFAARIFLKIRAEPFNSFKVERL